MYTNDSIVLKGGAAVSYKAPHRYDSRKFPLVLSEVQTGNNSHNTTTEYVSYLEPFGILKCIALCQSHISEQLNNFVITEQNANQQQF